MLDRMLTRLALAEDDDELEPLLTKILPYSITSLASPSASIRKSVLEILSHVNKRVKNTPEISLPFSDLWRFYNETNASVMVKNFCIMYIEMSFERLSGEDKTIIAPDLLVNIANVPSQHQEVILRIVSKGTFDQLSSLVLFCNCINLLNSSEDHLSKTLSSRLITKSVDAVEIHEAVVYYIFWILFPDDEAWNQVTMKLQMAPQYCSVLDIGVNCSMKPSLLLARVPIGLLLVLPNYLDEMGYKMLLHYAATRDMMQTKEICKSSKDIY